MNIILIILFALSFSISVFSLVITLKYIKEEKSRTKAKNPLENSIGKTIQNNALRSAQLTRDIQTLNMFCEYLLSKNPKISKAEFSEFQIKKIKQLSEQQKQVAPSEPK